MTTLYFEEHQFPRRTLRGRVWAIMLTILSAAGMGVALVCAPGGHVDLWTFLIFLGFMLAMGLLLLASKMTVQVDNQSIRIRWFPLFTETIPLADVVTFEACTYRGNPRSIYYSIGRGWLYYLYVSGNHGVQLELANGKRYLIGSQRAEELARAIGEAGGRLRQPC
jgi:hypothetical protein